jgi:hypothetical protein
MSSDAPDAAPFCRVVLVVQPRDGATGKTKKSNEYVFHPLNLVVAEVHVLRGQQFEDRGTRYCYLTQYNIDALACHDAVVPTRSFFENPYVSCVGCESGNASSAEAGPTCESGNASSAQAGPTYFNSSGVGIDHSPGPVAHRVRKALAQKLSKAASTSPSSDWAAPRALESLHMFRPQGLAFSVHAVGQVVDLQTYSLSILFLKGDA